MQSIKKRIYTEKPVLDEGYISPFYNEFHSFSFDKRANEAKRAIMKHPTKIPTLLFKGTEATPDSKNHKYLLPKDMTVSEFQTIIRKYIKLEPDQAIFLFVNNVLPVAHSTIEEVYRNHKSDDGYLKVTYTIESTFG